MWPRSWPMSPGQVRSWSQVKIPKAKSVLRETENALWVVGHVYLGMQLGGACVAVWQCEEDHSLDEGANMVHSALNLPLCLSVFFLVIWRWNTLVNLILLCKYLSITLFAFEKVLKKYLEASLWEWQLSITEALGLSGPCSYPVSLGFPNMCPCLRSFHAELAQLQPPNPVPSKWGGQLQLGCCLHFSGFSLKVTVGFCV